MDNHLHIAAIYIAAVYYIAISTHPKTSRLGETYDYAIIEIYTYQYIILIHITRFKSTKL